METEITIEPVWGKIRNDRKGVVVRFFYPKLLEKIYIKETSPALQGKVFRWLPTYQQLKEIKEKLEEVELINNNPNSKKGVSG